MVESYHTNAPDSIEMEKQLEESFQSNNPPTFDSFDIENNITRCLIMQ